MSTFDIKEYIAQIAQSVLSLQPDYDFQLTEVSGLAGLEGIISGQVAFDRQSLNAFSAFWGRCYYMLKTQQFNPYLLEKRQTDYKPYKSAS